MASRYQPMIGSSPFTTPWNNPMGGNGFGGMSDWGSAVAAGADLGASAPLPSIGMISSMPTGSVSIPAPQINQPTNFGGQLGFNLPTANLALSGLSTIGNLWAAFQAQKLAKQQFKYTKNVTDTNLANQMKSYNTTLADRAFSRAKVEGRDNASAQTYIDANQLKRYGT